MPVPPPKAHRRVGNSVFLFQCGMGVLDLNVVRQSGVVGMKVCVSFNNWEKYQSESKRLKNPSWFRFENKTYIDPLWFELDHLTGEFSAFMFLMMFVSQNGNETGSVTTTVQILSSLSRLPEPVLLKTLEKLASLGIAAFREISGNVGKFPETSGKIRKRREISRLHNITRQDTTEGVATNVATTPPNPDRVSKNQDLSKPSKNPDKPPIPDLKTLWNQHRQKLPEVLRITPKRQRLWSTRWKENPDADYWARVVKELAASAFCNGANDRGWKADVDFFLQPDTGVKALEGKYAGKDPSTNRVILDFGVRDV